MAGQLQGRYQNTSLLDSPRQIRILILRPGNDSLEGDIEHVTLDESPIYKALSYFWGNLKATESISINGNGIWVSENLSLALRHLQSKGYSRLWVDAICINPKDLQERAKQVLFMGTIYNRAEEVLVWLGPEDEDSEKAIEMLKLFHNIFSKNMAKDTDSPEALNGLLWSQILIGPRLLTFSIIAITGNEFG